MKRISIIAGMAVLAVVLVGCGPDQNASGGSSGNGDGGHAAGGKPDCSVAPAALVNDTLGITVGEPQATDNGTVVVCTYPPVSGSKSVLLRIQTDATAASFKVARAGYAEQNMKTQDFPGFADEAYTNVLSAASITTNTLVARKGSIEILISSSASFDKEKALEQKLFDALG